MKIGAKVRVYCAWCRKYFNGILLDYDANSWIPYTVAVYGHNYRDISIDSFEEVEYVDWRNAYEVEEKK